MPSTRDESFLLLSDVHLGADLVQHVRPWTVSRLKELARIDRDLAAMLDWYREHPDPCRPWCLVIAGDLVDFIGMSIAPREDTALATELNDDERAFGLGSARDHAAAKMRAVARRHSLVFDRLARFVAAGHRLVLVRGNHDIDFHWEDARDAFVQAVLERIPEHEEASDARAGIAERIEFHPWFYYVEGLLYVEHGHQFDAACNYPHLLAPICPADPDRLSWSLSDWLLRTVARPTPGLGSDGHGGRTALDYLRFGLSLGFVGAARLGYRYARALLVALRSGRRVLGEGARAVREEHERRLAELSERTRVRVEHLRELAALWPRSVSSGWLPVVRSAFLDKIGLGAVALVLAVAAVLSGLPLAVTIGLCTALAGAYAAYYLWSGRQRAIDVDPAAMMRRAARRIAETLPTRLVVMGHTHAPAIERVGDAVHYVNLGHWGVDDLEGEPPEEAPRTHLVLRWIDGALRAQLVRWDSTHGPRPVAQLED